MYKLDKMTLRHCENVSNLCTRLCQYMRCNNQFTMHCMVAGYVHDIGKMFIPKEILTKQGSLTDEEFNIIKSHTTLGYQYCMNDINLIPYSDGPWYHHEALNGTGYPRGLTQNDIPYSAQIIRVCDEYDALVTKRHYSTHVNISKTLDLLIKDTSPTQDMLALDNLRQNKSLGKINPKPLNALFKIVIDDTLYEISCVMNYIDYLKSQIKRLDTIERYDNKRISSKKANTKDYYTSGMEMLLQNGETFENYKKIREEYYAALDLRKKRINDLYNEIKILKRLKV